VGEITSAELQTQSSEWEKSHQQRTISEWGNPISGVVMWPPPSKENPIKRGVWTYELPWMDVLQ